MGYTITWNPGRAGRPGLLARMRDGLRGRRWVHVDSGPDVQVRDENGQWVDAEGGNLTTPGLTYSYRARIPMHWAPRANRLGVLRHRMRVRLYDARYGHEPDPWAEDD